MATLTDIKKMLSPLSSQSEKIGKSKRFEIDAEKIAKALLNEPAQAIAKADTDTDVDADDLVKSMFGRVSSIRQLLEKAEEAEDGRTFVTVDEDDAVAKEFEVAKGDSDDTDTDSESDDDADDDAEDTDTQKNDGWGDDADDDVEGPDDWPSDLSGAATRVRKRTTREKVVSTDPSQRKTISKAKVERDKRQEKRDRYREGQRHTRAVD